jgi:hypothetical protein
VSTKLHGGFSCGRHLATLSNGTFSGGKIDEEDDMGKTEVPPEKPVQMLRCFHEIPYKLAWNRTKSSAFTDRPVTA